MVKTPLACFRSYLLVLVCLFLAGCPSSRTPQATSEVTKQFSGGPMPLDAQKRFHEDMMKQESNRQNVHGGKR